MKYRWNKTWPAICLWVLAVAVSDADTVALRKKVDDVLARPVFAYGVHGCVIQALDTGQTLYSNHPMTLLMTASNLKLVTCAAAVDQLGADFRFTTRLVAESPLTKEGSLAGDLALAGSGDPVFNTANLLEMVKAAKAKGLKRVDGDIVADTGNFDRTPYGSGWSWDYLSDYYAAPVGGLNLNENVIGIVVKPGEHVGDPAVLAMDPPSGHLRFSSSVLTGAKGSTLRLDRERNLGGNVVRISGSVPLGFNKTEPQESVSAQDPAQYAVDVLLELLKSNGIVVRGVARKGDSKVRAQVLAEHVSAPLSEIIVPFMKWSDNLVAEALLRTMGSVKRNSGTIWDGRAVAYDVLRSAGCDMNGVHMSDGSGLSRLDMVAPENFVRLLAWMYKHKSSEAWIKALPIAGKDGTLRNRMKGTLAEGNVKAKTGYIGYVSSLSGYVTTAAGQPLVFSIIFNNQLDTTTPCRQAQDEICAYLAGITERM